MILSFSSQQANLDLSEAELMRIENGNAPTVDQYLSYHVEAQLLKASDQSCTTFVFPGKSLCNLLVTQTFKLDMNLNDTKSPRVSLYTPAFPFTNGFQDVEVVNILHINAHNASFQESCAVEGEVNGREANGKKNAKWKITFAEKNYPNPQLFHVILKLVGAVKPSNGSNL